VGKTEEASLSAVRDKVFSSFPEEEDLRRWFANTRRVEGPNKAGRSEGGRRGRVDWRSENPRALRGSEGEPKSESDIRQAIKESTVWLGDISAEKGGNSPSTQILQNSPQLALSSPPTLAFFPPSFESGK